MNKHNAQNAGNGISGLQISNIFWGKLTVVIVMHPFWKTSTPPDKSDQIHPCISVIIRPSAGQSYFFVSL
jgi:hypothetical protein